MGKFTQLLLSIVGATIGWFIGGPAGAAKGWFIGSTVGGLLSLQDTHTTTSGARITDFKTMSSKYGIPIARGYGTVRLASNVIWQSAITEYESKKTTCIKIDGPLFGLGSTKQCSTVVTFRYKQSAAFAFAEGPATSLTRVWADGELLYDTTQDVFGVLGTADQSAPLVGGVPGSNIYAFIARVVADNLLGTNRDAASTNNFTTYLGTEDQPIDPVIREALGDEAMAFRSIVYLLAKDLDLDAFGYRLPTLTAEVSFFGGSSTTGNFDLDIPIVGDELSPTFDVLGSVSGNPALTVGGNDTGTGSVTIYDVTTGGVFSDLDNAFPDGSPTGFFQLSSNFVGLRKVIQDSVNYFGPFNVRTGNQIYLQKYNTSDFTDLTYSTFDSSTNTLWTTFSGGAAAGFKLHVTQPRIDTQVYKYTNYRFEPNTYLNGENLYYPYISPNYDTGVNGAFTNGGGTQDTGREIFVAAGRVYWLVDGPGGVWINFTATSTVLGKGIVAPAPYYLRLKFEDGTNVASVANWTYEPIDDSFIFYVDVAGTSPVGLYKIKRTVFHLAMWFSINEVRLPASTTSGYYLNVTPSDSTAFQVGPVAGILRVAKNTTDLYVINTTNLILNDTILNVPGGLGTEGTVYIPELDVVRGGSFNVYYERGSSGTGQTLDQVVTNLMTTTDGDPKERLTASDIDVSELTADTVKGYPLIQQQTVRNAITPLQQYFFFDVVESDGKLKFVKRPQTNSFAMTEDELAAHEYGKTSTTVLVPVEYERQTEMELPRELTVNYTDIDLDYNQGTQRFRKQHTESHSNTVITLPLVMTSTEAAQTAEKLLNSTWSERVAPFKFKTGMKYCMVEPTDTGTITMNDGRVHTVRIIDAVLGANGIMEFTAVNETSSVYNSAATGSVSSNASQVIDNSQALVRIFDIPATFLPNVTEGQSGVVIGLGNYGDTFSGGRALIIGSGGTASNAGARDATQGMTFGVTKAPVGHINGPEAENAFDYESEIVMEVYGGAAPASKTEAEALNADQSGLLILGREIIAFTNVSSTDDVRVVGTDISFVNATSSIDSVTTDFIAAGFEADMVLRLYGAANNNNTTLWKIASVAQYKLTMTNAPANESAGNEITIFQAERTFTFSGGLIRGLYGTENFMYHSKGDDVTLAENLVFASVSDSSAEGMVTVVGASSSGVATGSDSTSFTNAALKPWSPVNVEVNDLADDLAIYWERRDKRYGGGIVDGTDAVDNSESSEVWEVDIIDGYTEGSETDVVRTVSSSSEGFTYTEGQQIENWGAVRNTPFIVEVYQVSDVAGRGFGRRTVITRDNDYSPIGETFVDETPGLAYSLGTSRLASGTHLIEGSGDISANALRLETSVDTEYTALSFDEAAGGTDIEVLTVVEMQGEGLTGLTAGTILRGRGLGSSDFTGFVVGLGGDPTDVFGIRHYLNGQTASGFSASIAFAWTVGTKYSIRARCYRNRIQGKIWEYGDPEPEKWQLNYYDGGAGPEYGWVGPFAYKTTNDPLYHYFAWAHRGLTAA